MLPAHLLTAHLIGRLRAVLALWLEGALLGQNGCQDTETRALENYLRGPRNPHTLSRLQRELLYDDAVCIDSWDPGQELEVERCFTPLVLAADPTSKQDDLAALLFSVVYHQHAIPVAWHIVGAQQREFRIYHFCRLLRRLAPTVPAPMLVHVLCDQGLCSCDL